MEDTTSTNSGNGFRFSDAVKAGFIATVVLAVVVALEGFNVGRMNGEMLVGKESEVYLIYAAGIAFVFAIGIFYALIYALLLSPIKMLNGVLKAFIFSILLTSISYFLGPQLPSIVAKIKGQSAAVAVSATQKPEEQQSSQNPSTNLDKISKNASTSLIDNALLMNWINHLVYSLGLAVMYRRRKF